MLSRCSSPSPSQAPSLKFQQPLETDIGNQKTGEEPRPKKGGTLQANAGRGRPGTGVASESEEEAGQKAEMEFSTVWKLGTLD